jgi:hypothetical protein
VVNELICDRSGVGQASALQGPVSDQQTADQALALLWASGKAERESIGDQHGEGQASALQGPVSDLQMSGHASKLPPSTGPAECWLSDSVTQARDRLFAYLNGQQVGIGDEESKEEWWPTPNEGDHTSDLIPIGCDDNRTTDINDTLMLTGISGSTDLQRQIKALIVE